MNTVFLVVASMSLAASLLIAPMLVVEHALKDKMKWTWVYYIWILVLIRLLIPFGGNVADQAFMLPALTHMAGEKTAQEPQETEYVPEYTAPKADTANMEAPAEEQDFFGQFVQHLWIVWVLGILVLLIRKITIYQSFVRYVRAGTSLVDDPALLDQVARLESRLGMKRPVDLGINPMVASPMLLGLRHPLIVVPSIDLSQKDLDFIVLHELVHLKRLDPIYKWVVQVTVCLHWFNPLVHLMRRRIERDCELSCDERVISLEGAQAVPEYGSMLLRAMASAGGYNESAGATELSENKKRLKERLNSMKTKKSAGALCLSVAMAALIFLGSACSRIYYPYHRRESGRTEHSAAIHERMELMSAPSLTLRVTDAAVKIESESGSKAWAEYDGSSYAVDVEEKDGMLSIICQAVAATNDGVITLHMPLQEIDSAAIDLEDSALWWPEITSDEVTLSSSGSFVSMSLATEFDGTLQAQVDGGMLEMLSLSDFADSSVRLDVDNAPSWVPPVLPEGFEQYGNAYVFSNGNQESKIEISVSSGSFVRLGNSENKSFGDLIFGWSQMPLPELEQQLEEIPDRVQSRLDDIFDSAQSTEPQTNGRQGRQQYFPSLVGKMVQEILSGPVTEFIDAILDYRPWGSGAEKVD